MLEILNIGRNGGGFFVNNVGDICCAGPSVGPGGDWWSEGQILTSGQLALYYVIKLGAMMK